MKITIGGPAGTGKGTVGRMLAEHYGYEFVSGGDLFRKVAEERGITMEEFDAYMKTHPEAQVDKEIDGIQTSMGEDQDNFVLESHIGWYFVPSAIKVKLDCELDERIRRIAGDGNKDRIAYTKDSFEDTKTKTLKRAKDHQARIVEIYGIKDMYADENFDFIIDTTNIDAKEVTQKIINYIKENHVK